MAVYLGLGANLGDRRQQLGLAVNLLVEAGFRLLHVSPMVESPAMLPQEAEASWNRPYLNIVIAGETDWSPEQALEIAKSIEIKLGREQGPRWSPRPMDIDILVWHDLVMVTSSLTIPHPGIRDRDFVITPLLHIAPNLQIPAVNQQSTTPFALSQGRKNIPLWMAILNITPDSFANGNSWFDRDALGQQVDKLVERDVQIIDIGAESTRPRADTISHEEEWHRLLPVLQMISEKLEGRQIRPRLSLDSRNARTVNKALAFGIDIINDVSGLDDPEMLAVARQSDGDIVAMHAMTVPVEPGVLLPPERPAVDQIREWIDRKADQWQSAGIDLSRMIIDPGIGFGKSSLQAYEIMSQCASLRESGMRLLIGHSRKSFMTGFTDRPAGLRDLETLGISMALCQQGVDIIRVHQPFIHQRAYRAWSHVNLST